MIRFCLGLVFFGFSLVLFMAIIIKPGPHPTEGMIVSSSMLYMSATVIYFGLRDLVKEAVKEIVKENIISIDKYRGTKELVRFSERDIKPL